MSTWWLVQYFTFEDFTALHPVDVQVCCLQLGPGAPASILCLQDTPQCRWCTHIVCLGNATQTHT